jgi:hypothetical protein
MNTLCSILTSEGKFHPPWHDSCSIQRQESTMNKRGLVFAALIFSMCAAAVYAEDGRRGALFQFGGGAAVPMYDAYTEEVFNSTDDVPGVDRITLSIDVALGFSVSPEGYIIGRIDGMGDRLDDGIDYVQLNVYLYSIGYRYYPAVTGLYLEGGFGRAAAVGQESYDADYVFDSSYGFGVAVGYDFNRDPRGFGLTLEAKYNSYRIENMDWSGIAFVGNLCWK